MTIHGYLSNPVARKTSAPRRSGADKLDSPTIRDDVSVSTAPETEHRPRRQLSARDWCCVAGAAVAGCIPVFGALTNHLIASLIVEDYPNHGFRPDYEPTPADRAALHTVMATPAVVSNLLGTALMLLHPAGLLAGGLMGGLLALGYYRLPSAEG